MKTLNKYHFKTFTIMIAILITLSIFTGCNASGKANSKIPSTTDIVDNIREAVKFPEMVEMDGKKLEKLYKIQPGTLDGFWGYLAFSNIKADEILIIKVKDSNDVENVRKSINVRIEQQANSFKDYLPNEYHLIQNHVLKTRGNYILFAVSKDADKIEDAFDRSFK